MRNINKAPQRICIFVFLFIVCAFGFASNNIIKTPLVMNVRAGNTRAAALALPFVPGGAGTALKTARAAGAATDLVAGAGEMVEGVKKGDVAQVALGALRMAGGAGQASSMAKAARGTTKSAADAGQAASSRRAAHGGAEEAASVRASAEAEVPDAGRAASSRGVTESVDLKLKYKDGWTPSQKAAADAKCQALSDADTVVTPAQRSGTSAASRYKKAGNTVPSGFDVDHVHDLQLGGSDTLSNMSPLDSSVNRSLGSQIYHQIKNLPPETAIDKVNIN